VLQGVPFTPQDPWRLTYLVLCQQQPPVRDGGQRGCAREHDTAWRYSRWWPGRFGP